VISTAIHVIVVMIAAVITTDTTTVITIPAIAQHLVFEEDSSTFEGDTVVST
jgi:hypothetical protein